MCLATKRHFMFVIGAIGWVPGPALVTKKKYCEIEGNRVQNVD